MTRKVYKYQLTRHGTNTLHIPVYSDVLCVREQAEEPVIYIATSDKEMKEDRVFEVVMTGEEVPRWSKGYVGTVQLGTWFIAHVFEVCTEYEVERLLANAAAVVNP